MNQYLSIHTVELLATITGLTSVYLVGRENIWNWFFGVICVSLYFVIFLEVKLYADMSLQVVFFILQIYGLYQWLYGGTGRTTLNIRSASFLTYAASFVATASLFILICFILQRYTDSSTIYIDAITTALSLVAQAMLGRKWLEHWLLWIIVDVISIPMYCMKGLYLTAALYFIFLLLCVFGYNRWKKQLYRSTCALNTRFLPANSKLLDATA